MTSAETRPAGSASFPEGEGWLNFHFGTYHPKRLLTNEEVASWGLTTQTGKLLTANDILQKVGILRRRVAQETETTLFMAKQAVHPIVEGVGREIDAVLFTTSYPTGAHNATEIIQTYHLEADDALDIHAACSGFALALTYLKDHEARFLGKRILIVASEKYSSTLPDLRNGEKDPSLSQTIFSDGAVAVSFIYGKDLTVLGYKNYLFPEELSPSICMPIDYNLVREPAIVVPVPQPENGIFFMDGNRVYRAVQRLHPKQVMEALEEVGIRPQNVALIIPHQASYPMLITLAKSLPDTLKEKIFYDLLDGNLSSASIPKALMRALHEERLKPGDVVVFDGFGAGLYASIVVAKLGQQN